MGARHVEDLFSAAFDDVLSDAERRRYDEHLTGCPQCATAAAEFRQAVDAVRNLPPARMPVRVVLPSTPPVVERRGGLWRWLPAPRVGGVPHLGPAWGAGAMAVVGVAAVVLVVHARLGGQGQTAAGLTLLDRSPTYHGLAQSGNGPALGAGSAGCPLPIMSTSATPGVTTGSNPAGFGNRVSVRDPQRPGQELILATTSRHYAPGSPVLVFAALTSGSGTRAVVPCVTLEPQQVVALAPSAGQNEAFGAVQAGPGSSAPVNGAGGSSNTSTGSSGSAPASSPVPAAGASRGGAPPAQALSAPRAMIVYGAGGYDTYLTPDQLASFAPFVLERPLAVAAPSGQTVGGTLPVQVVTIPAGVARGTVLRLVALVPAGWPGVGDHPAVEAVITIDVS